MIKHPSIAVIINGNLDTCRLGQINSALCRVKYLKQVAEVKVDVFCIQEYNWGLLRMLRKSPRLLKFPRERIIDGNNIKILYKKNIFLDYIFESILKITPIYSTWYYRHISKFFRNYDIISGHSIVGAQVAYATHIVNKIPFVVTWHGSDIHTYPKSNGYFRKIIGKILWTSSANIFVSKALLSSCKESYKKCPNAHILYNAPDLNFKEFSKEEKSYVRNKWGVSNNKVVAFVGNLVNVKNVESLPEIFRCIKLKIENCSFWIIGDGYKKKTLQEAMSTIGITCNFFGNIPPEQMPELMNCIDVLILPSKNESFGMVLVEAIACGANAVGSNRGGIPEVIGDENCFNLDSNFTNKISERIIYMLLNNVKQSVNTNFNWTKTAIEEINIYNKIMK